MQTSSSLPSRSAFVTACVGALAAGAAGGQIRAEHAYWSCVIRETGIRIE